MKLFSSLILLLLSCTSVFGFQNSFNRFQDMNYDGSPDEINYIVTWSSWDQPISWQFSIRIDSKEIYRHFVEKDSNITPFGDPDYIFNCNGTIECRRNWFLNDLFDTTVIIIKKSEPQHNNILKTFKLHGGQYYRKKFDLSDHEAIDNINRMIAFLSSRDIIGFSLPESPVFYGALMTYDPYYKTFIPLYRP